MSSRFLILVGAASLAMADAAFACRCAGPFTPQESYEHADAIVLAEVTGVSGDIDAEGGAIVTLQAEISWKHKVPAMLKVETRSTCAFDFMAGERYLVYLTRSGARADYSTTKCAGNLPYSQSASSIKWLQTRGTRTSY
jgi:hypothetical protein